ncbi:TPA: hypothetical protein DDW35_09865 [Candidatus Sumerlaeota bacterium]|jgi:hypothetical protein|nr:hypothetical protein [Candidatus Sumerlaeota bacterium]
MPYMKDGSPFLFDDATADIVGIKDSDGSEHSLFTQKVFGLVPDSTALGAAQRNYSAIQSALGVCVGMGGGRVVVDAPGQTITVDVSGSPLLIGSDTEFVVTRGTRLRPNSGNTLLSNVHNASTVHAVSGIVISVDGIVATLTATCVGHPFVVGNAVLVKHEASGVYNGVWRVFAVTSSSFSWRMPISAVSPTPAGDGVTAALADVNVAVTGGGSLDYDYPVNVPSSDLLPSMLTIFNKVGNLTMQNVRMLHAPKFACMYANCVSPRFKDIFLDTWSDGLHCDAPCWDVQIDGVTGMTGDDFLAITCNDAAIPSDAGASGDGVFGYSVRNLDIWSDKARLGCYLDNGRTISGVVYRDILLRNHETTAFHFDTGTTSTASAISDILIDGVKGRICNTSSQNLITVGGSGVMSIGSLVVRNIQPTNSVAGMLLLFSSGTTTNYAEVSYQYAVAATQSAIMIGSGSKVNRLSVRGFRHSADTTSGSLFGVLCSGTVGRIVFDDGVFLGTSGTGSIAGVYVPGAGSVGDVYFHNVEFGLRAHGVNNGVSVKVTFDNCTLNGGLAFVSSSIGLSATVIGGFVVSSVQGVLNLYGTSQTYAVRVSGMDANGATVMASYGTSSTYNWSNPDGQAPVDGSKITPMSGALFYNSNSSYASGVGLYCKGASTVTRLSA